MKNVVFSREAGLVPWTNIPGMWVFFLKGFRLAEEDQEGRGPSSEEKQVSKILTPPVSNFHLLLGDVDHFHLHFSRPFPAMIV